MPRKAAEIGLEIYMFVEERQNLILEELREKGQVRVRELAERFDVTEDLIRKDLNVLENAGQLKRKYGGAVPVRQNVQRILASRKKIPNMEAKKAIARKAMSLIEPGMIIYLDISTTNVQLARMIADAAVPVTVVTNMLEIMTILSHSTVDVIGIGGELDYGREGFIGAVAYEALRSFRFDLAFVGAVGIELETNAVTILTAAEGLTKKLMLQNSSRRYLVCEEEKLRKQGNYEFAQLDQFDGLISDRLLKTADAKVFADHGVQVL